MLKKLIAVACALSMVFSQVAAVSVNAADRTAPALRAATPKMNSTGISTTVKISLKFSENLYKSKYFTKIKLAKSSGSATTITRSIYKNYLKIGHKYALSYSTTYYLTIPAYSVKDKAGNILKKKIVVKFKTRAKPVTPSPSPTAKPTETPVNTIAEAWPVPYSNVAPNWQADARSLGTANTGYEVIRFDIIPKKANADVLVGYTDSSTVFENKDSDYWKLAMCVRLNKEGYIDAMNGCDGDEGGGLGATLSYIKYSLETKYSVEMRVNTTDKVYSVWVTPAGGSKTLIASNFKFRLLSATDDIGKVVFAGSTNSYKIENHTIAHASAPTPTPAPTVAPTPASGAQTVNNDAELAAALNNKSIGHITLASGSYAGFIINRPLEIIGGGATVTSFITINSGNVTVDNVNVVLNALYCHAYNVNAGLKNVTIKNGSITGFNNTSSTANGGSRGIVVAASQTTELTVDGVKFYKLRNGISANDGYFAGCKLTAIHNTFETTVAYALGQTENITIVNISENIFKAGTEGIGLGKGLTISAAGQTIFTVVTYLKANNNFSGYALNKDVADYRGPLV